MGLETGGNRRGESLSFCRDEQEYKDKVRTKGWKDLWMLKVGQKDSINGKGMEAVEYKALRPEPIRL